MQATILIIDDNVKWCKSLAQNFQQRGYQTRYALTRQEAQDILTQQPVQLVLLDIMLGEENGIDLLKELQLVYQQLPVIMITGFGSIDTAVQAIKLGAFDYVTKPLDFENLLTLVAKAMNMPPHKEANRCVNTRLLPRFITNHSSMLELAEKARRFAETDLPILICGENGTGKEVLADFIHAHSARSAHEMLKINCAAFPETLLDNELFGHEKGAYTGADTAFKGVFERAHESSLFLDEIGDMPLTIQAKILRTLQNHEIRRIGGDRTIRVNVRFIASTNKDLRKSIREQAFREDLFYRLNVATLQVPPLRERKEDLPLLAEYFLAEYANTNAAGVKSLSEPVLAKFLQHQWPGNVRELRNTLHYAATVATTAMLGVADLPPHFNHLEPQNSTPNLRTEMERKLILETLQKTNYNKRKTAELLNMSRNTLYHKLAKYGIPTPK